MNICEVKRKKNRLYFPYKLQFQRLDRQYSCYNNTRRTTLLTTERTVYTECICLYVWTVLGSHLVVIHIAHTIPLTLMVFVLTHTLRRASAGAKERAHVLQFLQMRRILHCWYVCMFVWHKNDFVLTFPTQNYGKIFILSKKIWQTKQCAYWAHMFECSWFY